MMLPPILKPFSRTSNVLRLALTLLILSPSQAFSACDCGSTDQNAPCTGKTISTTLSGEGSRNKPAREISFNWSFSSGNPTKDAVCGQFANGDYWLAPAAGESSVSIDSVEGLGGELFIDENPTPEKQGFLGVDYFKRVHSRLSVTNHDANENILPKLPLSFNTKTSLVAAIARDQKKNGGCGTKAIRPGCVDAYQVITVLDEVPEGAGANLLRPNIIRAEKELMSLDEFDFDRLPSIDYFDGASAERLASIRTVWSHHIEVFSMRDKNAYAYSEGGRAYRADLITDDYAATVAAQWHDNVTQMMSQATSSTQKRKALAAMLTYGKDIYYQVYNFDGQRERWFGVGAGQSLGRFPAAVFFAAMANDDKFGNALKLASSTQIDIGGGSVHELDQVNIGPNGPVWGDGDKDLAINQFDTGRYWGEMLGRQRFNGARYSEQSSNRGQRTKRDPYNYIDGPGGFPGTVYAGVTAGPIRALAAEMLLMPRMCDIVNYDPLVEYSLRLTETGKQVDNDPCAPPDPRELTGSIIEQMKKDGVPGADKLKGCDTFRARNCRYYGLSWDPEFTDAPTWGPKPSNTRECIPNGKDPIDGSTQTGRFSNIDADARKAQIGYPIFSIEGNWAKIHQGRKSCRVTLNAAPLPPSGFRLEVLR